jgi:hypothetical protein
MIVITLIVIIFILVLLYAILKEREEAGCNKFTIEKQTDDNKNIYIANTKIEENDTKEILVKKIISILSYHEKAGVWKRCYILSIILMIILFIVNNNSREKDNIYYWLILLMLFFTTHYLFFNYINYHHFRILKDNGTEIINKLILI